MSSQHLIFVYGTLRQGNPNHDKLLNTSNGEAKYLGLASTFDMFPLVIASRYNIPYLLEAPGLGKFVVGEVYEVDDRMLAVMDVLEDHPKFYERKVRKVKMEGSGEELDCWVYLMHDFNPHLTQLPHLEDYNQADSSYPQVEYVPKPLRKGGKDYWVDVKMSVDGLRNPSSVGANSCSDNV